MEARGRILIVDDELRLCRAVARLLRNEFEIMIANDGHEALELLAAGHRFDAILCDLAMPQLSGDLFRNAVRRRWRAQAERIIFLTAFAETRAGDVLDDHYVVAKPFEPLELRRLVGRVVDAARAGYFPEAV